MENRKGYQYERYSYIHTYIYIDPHTIDLLPVLQCWPSKFFFDVKKIQIPGY